MADNIEEYYGFRATPTTTFTPVALESYAEGSAEQNDFYSYIQLINNEWEQLTLEWDRFSENVPSEWELSSCDPEGCWFGGTTSRTFKLGTELKTSDYINVHFYPNNTEGMGTVQTRVWDPVTEDEFTLTFTGNAWPLGLGEVERHQLVVNQYPNPFQERTTIDYALTSSQATAANYELRVFNSVGQVVDQRNGLPQQGTLNLHINDASGLYLGVFYADGQKVGSFRMTRQ